MKDLADIVFMSSDVVRYHMKTLQRQGFICYDTSNKVCTVLLWVRQSETESPPELVKLQKKYLSVKLTSPEGKNITLNPGEIRKFCEKHKLNRRCIYDLLESKRKQHKGWTIAN